MDEELVQDDGRYCGTTLKTQLTLENIIVDAITTFRVVAPLEMLCRPKKTDDPQF